MIGLLRRDETDTGSPRLALLREEGRGFFQDLPLLLEQQHPPAQLAQLLLLVAGQAVALAALDLSLLHPQPQRLPRHPEIGCDLAQRFLGPRVQRHRLTAKLGRVRLAVLRLAWHGQTAFLPGRIPSAQLSTKPGALHVDDRVRVVVADPRLDAPPTQGLGAIAGDAVARP